MSPSGPALLLVALHLGASLVAAPYADDRRDASVPSLQFVSASLTSGPGIAPPPGTVLPHPELVGVVRVRGIDATRSSFRITLVAPLNGKHPSKQTRIVPSTWAPYDPNDKTLIRWTCKWPGPSSPEGWLVTIESLRSRPHKKVSGPIQHFLLPSAQPQSKSNPSD